MAHDHSHGDRNAYYLNQLFTIAVGGALGGVAVMLWYSGTLRYMLHPKFFSWVLLGGLMLLTLVVVRAMAVWRSVDAAPHTHDHDHEYEHGIQSAAKTTGFSAAATPPRLSAPVHHHDHGYDHSHDHGHDHGWAPWRYAVLLLPVVLYFLNLPNQGFAVDASDSLAGLDLRAPASVRSTGTAMVGFAELQQASLTPESRDYYEGKTIVLTGQYASSDPKRFTLVRFKRGCCAADAVPLKAVIMVDPGSAESVDPDKYRNKWVEVKGRVHFFQKPGGNEYITALILYPSKEDPLDKQVRIIPPPPNPYEN
ncbi:MAG TPA: hypothetical protein VH643_32345 [Gemmataceae bacterium]|jgi:hypothetical protein